MWHYPSFASWDSLLIYVPGTRYQESESPRVIETTWDRPFDAMRFNDPMHGLAHGLSTKPTITLKQASLDPALLDSKLRRLEEIAVPIIIDRSIILDGEEFGLETFRTLNAVRMRWRSSRSEAWLPLHKWFEEMRTFLQQNLE
jgi:hypothetical protein